MSTGTTRGKHSARPVRDTTGAGVAPDHHGIRSFAGRAGRLTTGQRRAIERCWPRYGVDDWERLDVDAAFGRRAPTVVEIGFGMGDALVSMAASDPDRNYLGIEVYPPGIGAALRGIESRGLENVRLIRADAIPVLVAMTDESLDAVLVFFPDPWPKKRHRKRRLIQAPFVRIVAEKLRRGGRFELATDWAPYAAEMLESIQAAGKFSNLASGEAYAHRPSYRPPTKFEQRGERLGHAIYDLVFERV